MCPFSKIGPCTDSRDSQMGSSARVNRLSRKPSWARKAQAEGKLIKWKRRSDFKSICDSIIGNINVDADVRIIFLDVDGVINHPSCDSQVTTSVCADCVEKLKSVLEHTSAKIVLSSTWRLNKRHRKTLFRYLRAIQVDQGVVVGETRDLRNQDKNRADEINDWLCNPNLYKKKNISTMSPWQVQSWVSLDDMDLASMQPKKHLKGNHIKLDPKFGLCMTESIESTIVKRLVKARTRSMDFTRNYINTYYSDSCSIYKMGALSDSVNKSLMGRPGKTTLSTEDGRSLPFCKKSTGSCLSYDISEETTSMSSIPQTMEKDGLPGLPTETDSLVVVSSVKNNDNVFD